MMKYRDSRKRIRRKEGGEKEHLLVRRFYCEHCCRHHIELPDCLVPRKHYDTETIAGVLDGVVTPGDLDSEDYPCTATMRRWICWFHENRANIEGHLRRAAQEHRVSVPDVPGGSLLDEIRHKSLRWLEDLMSVIYGTGESLAAGYG